MPRLRIDGAVWDQKEVEILKEAVKKYGSDNWFYIAALIKLKSSKNCKAQWEWLNASQYLEDSEEQQTDELNSTAEESSKEQDNPSNG